MLYTIEPKELFKLGADNNLRYWRISVDEDELVIHHGVYKGQLQEVREEILIGKGGRSVYQQRLSRLRSRVNKQKLKGYKDTIEEAISNKSNSLGFVQPMLAQSIQKAKNVNFEGAYVQFKYDGNRCLITRQGDKIIAYSRRGKLIDSIDHIIHNINIPDGCTLDGELYAHNYKLQQIRSWIARKQTNSQKLGYHIYDVVASDSYKDRLSFLRNLTFNNPKIAVVPTVLLEDIEQVNELKTNAIEQGYEGLIIRLDGYGYEADKRSKSLLKVKEFQDDEFIVLKIYLSDRDMPMAMCVAKNNKTFDVVLPGTMYEKQQAYYNRHKYIEKLLTIEYSQLTNDGIPFHGIAKAWREVHE